MEGAKMYRQAFRKLMYFAIASGILLLSNNTQAETISGYEDLVSLLAKGGSQQEQTDVQKELERAETEAQGKIIEEIISNSKLQGQGHRKVKAGVPTKLFKFSDKYAAIGFEATSYLKNYPEKIAFVLLFEMKGLNKVTYHDKYVSWTGKSAMSGYDSVTKAQLCDEFSDLTGIDDCRQSQKQRIKLLDIEAALAKKADKKHTHRLSDIKIDKIKSSQIDSSITRDSELDAAIKTAMKKYSVTSDKKSTKPLLDAAYVKRLESRISQMEKTIRQLSTLLKGVSRQKNDITFSGVNLHLVNGTGRTEGEVNGLGNLVVGYNESRTEGHVSKHTGSHNVIIGSKHSYSSYGGLAAGSTNTISGKYSSVCGGQWNTASGDYSTVSGGHLNSAKGKYSTVQGGLSAVATEENGCEGCK